MVTEEGRRKKAEGRRQKAEVNPPLAPPNPPLTPPRRGGEVGGLSNPPKIFRLKRRGGATHIILIRNF
ncbi:hypothetical protein [Okeania sp. SIO2B3]|uniref:hypothetical protein n=1 Tax=Okeania sp. SIO2B3 TaxID=2607784 RepID=UPI0013BF10BE|nr:hypothetical protein [Okeania sp. SIO2B3]NET40815.1 hypothetical protein [Okeania sp. SIO2B3]